MEQSRPRLDIIKLQAYSPAKYITGFEEKTGKRRGILFDHRCAGEGHMHRFGSILRSNAIKSPRNLTIVGPNRHTTAELTDSGITGESQKPSIQYRLVPTLVPLDAMWFAGLYPATRGHCHARRQPTTFLYHRLLIIDGFNLDTVSSSSP
jgi:hypothetical protein